MVRRTELSLSLSRETENEISSEKGWKCTVKTQTLSPRVPVRRNLSHKELPRVFICRENLMRPVAPQLKRAADPRAHARETRVLVVVLVPDYLLFRVVGEDGRGPGNGRVESTRNNALLCGTTISRRRVEHKGKLSLVPGRSSKRNDPLNCLLTLLSIERRGDRESRWGLYWCSTLKINSRKHAERGDEEQERSVSLAFSFSLSLSFPLIPVFVFTAVVRRSRVSRGTHRCKRNSLGYLFTARNLIRSSRRNNHPVAHQE